MRIAIVNSNFVAISKYSKKGTEIFAYILIRSLAKLAKKNNLEITAFASGDSHLPVPIESIAYKSCMADKDIGESYCYAFENALISKAFLDFGKYDLYHINIGNGEIVLPFARFIKKPIVVTMHDSLDIDRIRKYLSFFRDVKNVHFVSVSDAQRASMHDLDYTATIYHGVDTKNIWKFDPEGGEKIVWVGRAIADKGIDEVIRVIKKTHKKANLFPLVKLESPNWIKKMELNSKIIIKDITISYELNRHELISSYQHGKLFLFPIQWEEPFGLVMIEAMACGTPIIAYARGSVPEVVVDGETGFIVNPSNEDIRGDFIIKKTGIEGLCEAIDRIYAMPRDEYMTMRRKCRIHVEKNFTSDKMASNYINLYKKVLGQS
ncbi:glycosyltransferase [Patescibacteria group bacterium]|nr:glycosyltransferase [Patescibacteria group bacterium]MBU4017520.1 glycosyltransferase [Patescibacteria group bacterium]